MQLENLLKDFGLSEKEVAIYMALLDMGPSPVRVLAQKTGVNRGTSYDILKNLISLGLVSYYNKETHQYFVAESPERLLHALEDKQQKLLRVKADVERELPQLQAQFLKFGGKPVMKLYDGLKGVRLVLEDVLATMSRSDNKKYFVYSSANVRNNVGKAMPDFSKKRVVKKIHVQTIALGPGGELRGLDERKWLPIDKNNLSATYEIIYGGKVAHISLDEAEQPVCVLVENAGIYETQRLIFEGLWAVLGSDEPSGS